MSSPARTVAIIGASRDRAKFGNKAVRAFRDAGWRVFPVHPAESEIEGLAAFPNLAAIAEPLDAVSVYVPPAVGLRLLPEIAARRPATIWFNPGADSSEIAAEAARLGLAVKFACSMIAIGRAPGDFPSA